MQTFFQLLFCFFLRSDDVDHSTKTINPNRIFTYLLVFLLFPILGFSNLNASSEEQGFKNWCIFFWLLAIISCLYPFCKTCDPEDELPFSNKKFFQDNSGL